MPLNFWTVGCIYGATSVALGAFGAHGLKNRVSDPKKIANWETAAHYQVSYYASHIALWHIFPLINTQIIHSVVLLMATSFAPQNRIAASLLTTGMTMFSGSIYLLVLDPDRFKFVGPVTPLGGLCLIGGWIALAFGKRLPLQRPPQLWMTVYTIGF